jgi:hypothetical protein
VTALLVPYEQLTEAKLDIVEHVKVPGRVNSVGIVTWKTEPVATGQSTVTAIFKVVVSPFLLLPNEGVNEVNGLRLVIATIAPSLSYSIFLLPESIV